MPQILEWSNAFKTGNHDIDIDHQSLFVLVNALSGQMEKGADEMAILSTIAALEDYINVHFAREEELMKFCKFDGLEAHVAAHRKLSGQVKIYRGKYENDRANFDLTDFTGFLASWLFEHILGEDRKYIPALQNMGKASEAPEAAALRLLSTLERL